MPTNRHVFYVLIAIAAAIGGLWVGRSPGAELESQTICEYARFHAAHWVFDDKPDQPMEYNWQTPQRHLHRKTLLELYLAMGGAREAQNPSYLDTLNLAGRDGWRLLYSESSTSRGLKNDTFVFIREK